MQPGTAQVGPRARIAIIYNPEKDPQMPYIGIHMQDIPRAYLAEADSMVAGSDEGLSPYLLTRVDDEQLERVIPDFDKIIADLKLEFNQNRIEEVVDLVQIAEGGLHDGERRSSCGFSTQHPRAEFNRRESSRFGKINFRPDPNRLRVLAIPKQTNRLLVVMKPASPRRNPEVIQIRWSLPPTLVVDECRN